MKNTKSVDRGRQSCHDDVKFVNMADIVPAPGGGWKAPGVRGWAAPGARGRATPGGGCAARGARGWAASGA